MANSDTQAIPRALELDPTGWPAPPAQSKIQELPFAQISWENFERLCLRLARLDSEIEFCRIYGTRGQSQEGIDLYGRRTLEPKYRVYQCKREEDFGPAKIREAVTTFLAGDWVERTRTFVLCNKEDLRSNVRTEALESQRAILFEKQVTFEVWDASELTVRLKDHPELVDDFFGRVWAEAFCGREKATALKTRLDGPDAARLRDDLRTLYQSIFQMADPGFPVDPAQNHLALAERYILPDIIEDRSRTVTSPSEQRSTQQQTSPPSEHPVAPTSHRDETVHLRRPINDWLSENLQSIVIGGPGMGKSALLRFLALDILAQHPRCESFATAHAARLPIWIPFAYWTTALAVEDAPSKSLADILEQWLHHLGQDSMVTRLRTALTDDRLLLLVDGLDEYRSEGSAAVAMSQLKIVVAQRGCPVIATCRPVGFDRLNIQQVGWKIAHLAEFTLQQQRELAKVWFRFKFQRQESSVSAEIDRLTVAAAETLVSDTRRSPGLVELAGTPLLLSLLIYLKASNYPLPSNRFQAYGALVDHLISVHPAARRKAAFLTHSASQFLLEDFKTVFAVLAFRVSIEYPEGTISRDEAFKAVADFLEDREHGFGYSRPEARRKSAELIDIGESNLGIVVERGPSFYGFVHRVFQEFLSAVYLARLPIEKQTELLAQKGADPQWREIVLCFLHQLARQNEVASFVEQLKALRTDPVSTCAIDSILCEVAIGRFNAPTGLCVSLCDHFIAQIETGHWIPQRRHLLRTLLGGIYSTKVGQPIIEAIRRWFPRHGERRTGYLLALSRDSKDETVTGVLLRALWDENLANQREAALAIAARAQQQPDVANRLIKILREPNPVSVAAATVEALLEGWPDHAIWSDIEDRLRHSAGCDLRFLAIRRRVLTGRMTADDRHEIMFFASQRFSLAWSYKSALADTILKGWPGDRELMDRALRSIEPRVIYEDSFDDTVALSLLLDGYATEPEVAEALANIIRTADYPFLSNAYWAWTKVSERFVGNQQLIAAADAWLKDKRSDHHYPEISFAARLGRTSTAKTKLLGQLDKSFPFWAAGALLDGWGMDDTEVANALSRLATSDRSSEIGCLLPRIISDPSECFSRLITLLRDRKCSRPDYVLTGLIEIATATQTDTIVQAALPWADGGDAHWRSAVAGQLIASYTTHPLVRELAKRELSRRDGNVVAVASAFSNDQQVHNDLLRIATPLPTALRSEIIDFLDANALASPFCLDLLGSYDWEDGAELKVKAAIAYHRALSAAGLPTDSQVSQLAKDFVCGGFDFEARRQAAFCGLEILNRLDLVVEAYVVRHERLPLEFGNYSSPNLPFVRHILENWTSIRAALGDQFAVVFFGSADRDLWRWNDIASIVDEYSVPREELLTVLKESGSSQLFEELLRFIGRVSPRSPMLLRECLKIIRHEGHPTQRWIDLDTAIELIGRDFAGDGRVLAALRESIQGHPYHPEAVIWAMCEGWPDAAEVGEEFAERKKDVLEASYLTPFHTQLLCARGSASDVFEALMRFLSYPHDDSLRYFSRSVSRPIVGRARRDEELHGLLKRRLKSPQNTSETVSICRILRLATGLDDELRAWCRTVATANDSDVYPWRSGTDITTGGVRTEWEIGIELLYGSARP